MEPLDDGEWESLGEQPSTIGPADRPLQSAAESTMNTDRNHMIEETSASDECQNEVSTAIMLAAGPHRTATLTNDNESRILAVSQRLESKRQLKDKLMKHPLHLLWSRFLRYLVNEIWDLDARIRLALILILLGLVTKVLLLSTAFLWYPRLFVVPALILVPFFYLNPSYVPVKLERAFHALQNPLKLADALGDFDPSALRKVVCLCLFIPTLLEVRTIQFLSQIRVEASWGFIYHLTISGLIAAVMGAAYIKLDKSPRECTHIGLVCLYGSALFVVTIIQFDIWKIPVLVAPFFVATGILLLHSVDDSYEWCSQAIHNALRMSLRDALASVSESISQDEMLQLAMLRWLVDYWGSTQQQSAESTAGPSTATPAPRTSNASRRNMSLVAVPPERQLTWNELLPMLTVTSEQIRTEVDILQNGRAGSESIHEPGDQRSESLVVHESSNQHQQYTSSMPASSSSSPSPGSVSDFQTMLASMDLDAHAKPAVMAYKKAVESFPPSREMAVLLSVARRCPALLALLWELIFAQSGSFVSTVALLPFIAFELFRCKNWSESCKRAANKPEINTGGLGFGAEALFLENVDPMVILLSTDKLSLHRPPTLLGVWMNVVSSVAALEMGLIAARCVQTTTAAIDFAQNIMSLAEFGYQVASHGWMHGAGVIAKELIIQRARAAREPNMHETKYTSAAIRAVENSRKVTKNLQILMEEENASHFLPPVFGFVSVAVGRGWLWGREENVPVSTHTQSTVVIEELDSSNTEATDVSNNILDARDDSTIIPPRIQSTVLHEEMVISASKSPESSNGRAVEGICALDQKLVSEIMDLIAAASSRQLIDQVEKNDLCERLSKLKSEGLSERGWLEATKRTLEGLILIDERAGMLAMDNNCMGGESTEETRNPHGDACVPSLSDDQAALESERCTNGRTEEMYEPINNSHESGLMSQVVDIDSESVIPPVPSTGFQQGFSGESQASGDNIWMQLGGGLAVVGAVVGMAAVAMQSNNNSDGRRSRERHRRDEHFQPSQ
ncbi:hypothetical protein MPSEU_000217500 [Mayamaea pseudoterrestris]|nr:hypothetical protein MPSEU_000217500 [Mayamaea pseudoterrestris]